eukprot:1958911-Prymnesium_polylepis.1
MEKIARRPSSLPRISWLRPTVGAAQICIRAMRRHHKGPDGAGLAASQATSRTWGRSRCAMASSSARCMRCKHTRTPRRVMTRCAPCVDESCAVCGWCDARRSISRLIRAKKGSCRTATIAGRGGSRRRRVRFCRLVRFAGL